MSFFRNLLIANAMKSTIPTDVDAWLLSYVQGTGTQYVDTGVYGNLETELGITVLLTEESATTYSRLAGNLGDNTNSITILTTFETGGRSWFGSSFASTSIVSQNTKFTAVINKDNILIDDVVIRNLSATTEFNTVGSLLMGTSGSTLTCIIGNIYSGYVKQNGITVFNGLACEQLDGTICMWDEVTNTYKLNQGTDDFLGGERIGYILNGIAYNLDGTEMFPEETS